MNAEATSSPMPPSGIGMFRRSIDACIVAYALFHVCHVVVRHRTSPLTQRSLFLGGGVGFIFLGSAGELWNRSRRRSSCGTSCLR